MKFSLFPNHGALNSKPVFDAFAQGVRNLGHEVVLHDLNADFFVIWSVLWQGRMRGNQEIWNFAKKAKKTVIILEVGTLIRGTTWKIGVNHITALGYDFDNFQIDYQRSKKLGLSLKPWKKTGQNIVIFGQHSQSEQWSNRLPVNAWLENLVTEIKKCSNRPIIYRPHPRDRFFQKIGDFHTSIPIKIPNSHDVYDHEKELNNAWCAINACSGPGVQSVIEGVPVFVEKDSLAWPVSIKDLSTIEQPSYPERELWFEKICNTEWTIDEIASGQPLIKVTKNLDNS
jgi:hypothetical protein